MNNTDNTGCSWSLACIAILIRPDSLFLRVVLSPMGRIIPLIYGKKSRNVWNHQPASICLGWIMNKNISVAKKKLLVSHLPC
jgi:hypothetical protein